MIKTECMQFTKPHLSRAGIGTWIGGAIPILSLALVSLTGCGQSEPARFRLNMASLTINEVAPKHRQEIADTLTALFGTPDEPFAPEICELDMQKLKMAAGPVVSQPYGASKGLYREHCAHCHGISGDGMGPTAAFLNPYPRDYRLGKFKAKSTYNFAMPTREDLARVLRDGIPGTSMPSFKLLPEIERDAILEYVKYLTLRGQTERALIQVCTTELGPEDSLVDFFKQESINDYVLAPLVETWMTAEENIIYPEAPPEMPLEESIAKGRELFHSAAKGNCMQCHGNLGLGDGQRTDFDDWTKEINDLLAKKPDEAHLAAVLAPRNIVPRNLRQGNYRFGRRPIDLYRRLATGITGTPMPAVGPATPGATGTLTSEEIWHVVHYVRSLPYEGLSRPTEAQMAEMRRTSL